MERSLLRRAGAEFIGTFALVIAATGHISGAHFNPAVTIAFAVTRHFPWREVVYYVVA